MLNVYKLRNRKTTALVAICLCMFITLAVGQNVNIPNKTGPMGLQVNTYTGNLFFTRIDLLIPSRGFSLDIAFNYNSFNFQQKGPFGNGWSNNYNIKYRNDVEGNVTLMWGDGREDYYTKTGSSFTGPTGFFTRLAAYQPGKLKLTEKDGTEFFFDDATHRRITAIKDLNGNMVRFTYTDTLLTTITSPSGQTITLSYNSNNLLNKVTDANGNPTRSWSFQYDASGNLIKVADPLTNDYRYSYLVNGPLKEIKDRNGNVVNIIYYNNFAVSELIGCNKRISFAYDAATLSTIATDHAGNGENQATRYLYKNINGNIWLAGIQGNCCGYTMDFEYDIAGNKIKETDANGNITRYTYDTWGNVTSVTDALGQVYTYTYTNDLHFIKSMTDPKGFTSEMIYDNRGNLLQIKEPNNRVYTAVYGPNGDILSSTDPMGNSYTYQYDNFGNPVQVTGPLGYKATMAFDARGRLLSIVDNKNNTITAEYDILNRLQKIIDPLNQYISLQYDANGNPLKVTNKNGDETYILYDASNRPTSLKDPLGQYDAIMYDEQDNMIAYTNVLGQKVTLKYDKQNRMTEATNNIGETINFTYDNKGNLTEIKLPNGQQISYLYDALDRLTNVIDKQGHLRAITYDANGNITSIKNGTGALTTATYDNLNRPIKITDPLGNFTLLEYDENDRLKKITDRNGNSSSYTYDSRNRITTYTDHLGAKTVVSYDANNNVTGLTDQNGNTTQYTYDAIDRVKLITFPDGKSMEYTYDKKDNIKSVKLTDGNIIFYTYDSLNRMITKTLPDGHTYTYTYNGIGKILSASNKFGTVNFTYDALNRVVSESFKGRTVNYNYHTTGRTLSTTYPNGTLITMEYDLRNRLQTVRKNGNQVASYTYNNANEPITKTLANGLTTTYQYDIANRLIGYSTGTLQQTQINYDKQGNKTSIIRSLNPSMSEYFFYDNNYRLVNYKRGTIVSPNLEHSYAYDALGNRTSTTINGTTTFFTSNNLNQLTKKQHGAAITNLEYDALGNLSYDGKFFKTYDAEKRLIKDSASPSVVIAYQYDALGRRMGKLSNGKIYEYDFAGITPTGEYINGQQQTYQVMTGFLSPLTITRNNETYYYLQNELGSIEALTNAAGRLIERYEYDPYGNQKIYDSLGNTLTASLLGNRIGFTGQIFDSATSSNVFFFRNYNPELGTFQQRDLIGYADGMGLYQYVGNNPANGVDIWGLEDCNGNKRKEIGYAITVSSNLKSIKEKRVDYLNNRDNAEIQRLKKEAAWADQQGKAKFRPSDLEYIETGKPPLKTEYGEFSEIVHQRRVKRANEYFDQAQNSRIKASNIEQSMKGRSNVKGNLKSLGNGLDALNVLTKVEALGSALVDGQTDGYHTQEMQAGGDLAFTLLTLTPGVGQTIGTVDGIIEMVTGKGMTGHAADLGAFLGEISVENPDALDDASWEQAVASGKTRQWIIARAKIQQKQQSNPNCPQNGNTGGTMRPSPYPGNPQSGTIQILGSYDPNEIIGPAGQPNKRWVSVKDRLPYTINFENDTTATAPAKLVRITAPVQTKMDAATLELGSFGFNSLSFSIPPGTSAYYQRLDCRDSLGIFVDITAGYDVINNQIFWLLQSIDPITLQTPADPLKGLLLLQDTTNPSNGHGFVNFSIKPRPNAVTLDSILAHASIIFDSNEPIGTNTERNTIDAFAPTTVLNELPPASATTVALSWMGKDDTNGCGVRHYTLYVSEDGINFNLIRTGITRTDTTLTLKPETTCYFFVLATDTAGNTELLRPGAIQSTYIGSTLPVGWLYFTGTNRGSNNLLEWATTHEVQVRYFVLERSTNGQNFEPLQQLKPNGGLQTPGSYQYLDLRADKLYKNALYYRIKQVDINGRIHYSKIIRLQMPAVGGTPSMVYPNPTQSHVIVRIGTEKLLKTKAILSDSRGRQVQQVVITLPNQVISLHQLPAGLYYLKLSNGEVIKIMKQ